ncbi:MAG TPA: hypothetical protein VK215_13090 [Acidimicrobiales bacterium]|nr:hypothetical protein [Acidimicrobiales bacterium]HLN43387.1 hypothetical protein [Acidimicrobiales bacterium]
MSESTYGTTTREALHTIAAHILARKRFGVSGRFGLRAGPGGIATPSFGDAPETIRLVGLGLIREVGGTCTRMPVDGSTLRELAAFTDADLDEPFSCGPDTPPLGPVDVAFRLAKQTAAEIADWFALAWRVLDDVLTSLPGDVEVATIQLWPEHFDAATTVTQPGSDAVNLGFSPGDASESEPYLYVGPWGGGRPGDPGFWNVPFGAMRRRSELPDGVDRAESCRRFLETGLGLVASP